MTTPTMIEHHEALARADGDERVPEAVQVWKQELPAGDYTVDEHRSYAEFVGRTLGVYPVQGRFATVSGHVRVTEAVESTEVELVTRAGSLETGNRLRDGLLRRWYLAADEHPQVRFRSEHIQPLGDDTFAAHGELTVRDVTQPAVFHVTHRDVWVEDGCRHLAFTGAAEIDRRAFGVPSPELLAGFGALSSRTVTVRVRIVAHHPEGR